MKIIFSGTPKFSIPSLQFIHKNYELLAVITKPDKPSGRGLKLSPTPVKSYAINNHIKYFQPDNLKDREFLANIKKLEPDFIIDAAFGFILPEEFLKLPNKACLNIHPSLLPGYRGPNPIQRVIMNNESFTGITCHLMTVEIDKGQIIHQEKLNITPETDYEILYERLSLLCVKVIKNSLEKYEKNEFLPIPADVYKVKNVYAKKLNPEEYLINWDKDSISINNLIKALKNKPTAYTFYEHSPLKIYTSEIVNEFGAQEKFIQGEIVYADTKNGIIVKTGDGFLKIIELQRHNKKVLNYKDFLNGTKLNSKESFQNA